MERNIKILGIDPGSRRIGYGIIKKSGATLTFVEASLLKIKSKDDFGALYETKKEIDKLIEKHQPEILAVEKLYFVKNQKTGMQVAHARGAIILAALEHGLLIKEYAPNEIKMKLTGYGFSDKKAVAKIVKLILKKPDLKVIDDVSDALGIAIIASQKSWN